MKKKPTSTVAGIDDEDDNGKTSTKNGKNTFTVDAFPENWTLPF